MCLHTLRTGVNVSFPAGGDPGEQALQAVRVLQRVRVLRLLRHGGGGGGARRNQDRLHQADVRALRPVFCVERESDSFSLIAVTMREGTERSHPGCVMRFVPVQVSVRYMNSATQFQLICA